MVRVKVYRCRESGRLFGFEAEGHSGFAPAGEDIVCAAVSALTTVTVLGLQARLGLNPNVAVDEARGFLRCRLDMDALDEPLALRAEDLLATMALGLEQIAAQHREYASVEEILC